MTKRIKDMTVAEIEHKRAYDSQYQTAHPEIIGKIRRRYRAAHPDKVHAAGARWRAAHPDRVRAANARRCRAAHPEVTQ